MKIIIHFKNITTLELELELQPGEIHNSSSPIEVAQALIKIIPGDSFLFQVNNHIINLNEILYLEFVQ